MNLKASQDTINIKFLHFFFTVFFIVCFWSKPFIITSENNTYPELTFYVNSVLASTDETVDDLEKFNDVIVQDSTEESESERVANKRRTLWIIAAFMVVFVVFILMRFLNASPK